jgi:flagellar motility protein MotE (MotC chaperone)
MIARLMRTAASLLGYFCVATILAELIVMSYLTLSWQPGRERLMQALAVARGVDILALKKQVAEGAEQLAPEQVSYEQIRETRAVSTRHLELREQALRQGLEQLASEQRELTEQMARHQQLRTAFQQQLSDLQQGAVASGRENARLKLESLKPKQAKQQLVEMLDNDELEEVVALLSDMPDSKAGKIMAEFKDGEEVEQLYEILRCIREGHPESQLATGTLDRLSQTTPTNPSTTR